jgi:hypothetical protein
MFTTVLLAASVLLSPPQAPTPKNGNMADPSFPLPLYQPEPVAYLNLLGRHTLGSVDGNETGLEWVLADGKALGCTIASPPVPLRAYCTLPISRDDYCLIKGVVGTECGIIAEWYLGHGVSALVDLGGPFAFCRAGISWWPIEGCGLSWRFDVLRWQCEFAWQGDQDPLVNVTGVVLFSLVMSQPVVH